MRILLVVWNFYPNTALTNHTKATVRGMQESGCNVDVLSIKPIMTDEKDCIKGQSHSSAKLIPTAYGMFRDFLLLRKAVRNYDVVYCTTPEKRVIDWIYKRTRGRKIPIIHERTEMPDITKTGESLSCYLRQVSLFDKVFVISNPIKDYFIKNGVPAEKIHIYPMIVDPHRFDNLKKQDVPYRYVAYCGNLSNTKDGVADLIAAYGASHAKNTHMLMLIGSKPLPEELKIYEDLIQKYSLQDKIVFRGQVERDEMPQILMNADALLLCRPDNRQALGGFPTKLGEYLSTGNPVLVTRVGDIDKYIVDGENGYLAKPSDVEDFSRKLDIIIDDYDKAKQVGERGKELANDAFNYSVQTKKVVEIIKTLL